MSSSTSLFVIETPPLSPCVSLEETGLLTDALKQRLEGLLTKPSASNGRTVGKTGSSSTLDTLRAIVPKGLAFDSLYQLVQYLHLSLIECFGYETIVRVISVDATTDSSSTTSQSIAIRNSGVLVELKLLTLEVPTEDPAMRAVTIQEFVSTGNDNHMAALASPSPSTAAAVKSRKHGLVDSNLDDLDDDDSSEDDEMLLDLMQKKKIGRGRSRGKKNSSNKQKSPKKAKPKALPKRPDNEWEDYDCDNSDDDNNDNAHHNNNDEEPAGEALKKRYEEKWQMMAQKLQEYRDKHGDCLVPRTYAVDRALASWVVRQREAYRQDRLPQPRIDRLNAMDFAWRVRHIVTWDSMYERLQVYHFQYGHCNVTRQEDPKLVKWVQMQRHNYHHGKISEDRIAAMEKLEFSWDGPLLYQAKAITADGTSAAQLGGHANRKGTMEHWNQMLAQLTVYKEEYGNCIVPRTHDFDLAAWVKNQRKRKTLTEEQKAKLNDIGFDWNPPKGCPSYTFEEMVERLTVFKERYGNCMVPGIYPDDLPLARWVQYMRDNYKKNTLTNQQIFELDAMGFTWSGRGRGRQKINYITDIPTNHPIFANVQVEPPRRDGAGIWSSNTDPELWQAQFEKLCAFRAQHGHANVSRNYLEDRTLAHFVTAQRKLYHKNKLTDEPIQQLESIGFTWRVHRHWEESFQLLKAYYETHGNTDVPRNYQEDSSLGRWVYEQRMFGQRKKLTQDRIDRMKELGFVWNPPSANSKVPNNLRAADQNPHQPPLMDDGLAAGASPPAPAWPAPTMGGGDVAVAASPTGPALPPLAAAAQEHKKLPKYSLERAVQDRKELRLENEELRRKLREAEEKNLWEDRFEHLKIYQDLHGNCLVPTAFSNLGNWVERQRDLYKREAISQERIERLGSLGFVWVRPPGRPKRGEGPAKRRENEKMLEEEVRLQEQKVQLLEAKVKLQQEKLKLKMVKDSSINPKYRRKSTDNSAGTRSPPNAKKARKS